MTEPPLVVVLVDRRHRRDCAVWTVEGPWDCTCGLVPSSEGGGNQEHLSSAEAAAPAGPERRV